VIGVKALVAVLAVFAMLCVPLGFAGIASAAGERDLTLVVEQGSTDRLGGGDWVSIRAGDVRVGVVYGTTTHLNKVYVFAEYKRFLGGADVYDARGTYLRTTGVPVYTIFGQSFDEMVEFQDRNNDSLLNLARLARNDTSADMPAKATSLARAWTATIKNQTATGVNVTVETTNVPYDIVWSPLPRRGTPGDGALDRLAFTFHLNITVRNVSGDVPWYRVTVTDGGRDITHVEYLGNRTYSGQAVAMAAKYDHRIEGWDFARPADLLALETRAFVGNYLPQRVGEFVHMAYHSEARDPSGYRQRPNDTVAADPRLLTRDVVYFDDEWDRVGRLVWQSNVTVDGVPARMQFQVQGGEAFAARHAGAAFFGFAVRGAYIYPNGRVIVHDPGLDAIADLWSLPETLNLTPLTVLGIQVAIAAFAMGAAVLVRAKGRRAR